MHCEIQLRDKRLCLLFKRRKPKTGPGLENGFSFGILCKGIMQRPCFMNNSMQCSDTRQIFFLGREEAFIQIQAKIIYIVLHR